jgi:hypothetical protein
MRYPFREDMQKGHREVTADPAEVRGPSGFQRSGLDQSGRSAKEGSRRIGILFFA